MSVWDFSGLNDIFQVFDKFLLIFVKVCCLFFRRMRDVMAEDGVISKEIRNKMRPEHCLGVLLS